MERLYSAIYVKPEVTNEQLEALGFRGRIWKPSFTKAEYEANYYDEDSDYIIMMSSQRQLLFYPKGWEVLAGKVQCLLFDMMEAGMLEKQVHDMSTKERVR